MRATLQSTLVVGMMMASLAHGFLPAFQRSAAVTRPAARRMMASRTLAMAANPKVRGVASMLLVDRWMM